MICSEKRNRGKLREIKKNQRKREFMGTEEIKQNQGKLKEIKGTCKRESRQTKDQQKS